MNILVRIYGDSLSLPVPRDNVFYTGTYGELFRRRLAREGHCVSLYNRASYGAPLKDVLAAWENDRACFDVSGGILVAHCGITDCAPRPINRAMRACVRRLPEKPRQRVIDFLHRNRAAILNRGFMWRHTDPVPFGLRYRSWLTAAAATAHVFAFNIAPTWPETDVHSPGLAASIAMYNEIISNSVRLIDKNIVLVDAHRAITSAEEGVKKYISADGHHLTPAGHELYADLLFQKVENLLSSGEQLTGHAGEAPKAR
jgi:hypothetical protein